MSGLIVGLVTSQKAKTHRTKKKQLNGAKIVRYDVLSKVIAKHFQWTTGFIPE